MQPSFSLPLAAAAYLALASLAAAVLFRLDKRRAQRGERRIPESTLLFAAVLGGTPGAYWARARFRHKTRKQPFSMQLHLVALLQAAGIGYVAIERAAGG